MADDREHKETNRQLRNLVKTLERIHLTMVRRETEDSPGIPVVPTPETRQDSKLPAETVPVYLFGSEKPLVGMATVQADEIRISLRRSQLPESVRKLVGLELMESVAVGFEFISDTTYSKEN